MADGEEVDRDAMAETALVVAPTPGPDTGAHDSRLTPIGERDRGDGLEPGKRLGRYVIVKKIGRGGMGTVYAAYDPELDRNVALKLVSAGAEVEDGDEGRARLLREAQAIACLSHPNVVAIHDVGIWEDYVVIAMEFIEGRSLRAWARTPRDWREIVEIHLEAARGLRAAHAAGLVHRDFKPDNVLVGVDGRVRVADFGLARPADADEPPPAAVLEPTSESGTGFTTDPKLTLTGTTLGTPAYMSPEQHRCEMVDARSDQFSFCVSLWETLYGQRPFSGRTLGELARQTCGHEITHPTNRRRVPAGIQHALLRGLAAQPDERFPGMDALMDALRRPLLRRNAGRMVAWGGLAAGVVAIVVGVTPAVSRTEGPRCERSAAEARLAGVWDDEVRARVESAVLGSDRSFAADTWERVEAGLDEYAASWSDAHVEACVATHIRGEQTPRWLDDRMKCLERRLDGLGRLTGKLSEANEDLVTVAGLRVRELPPVDHCEGAGLEGTKPLPADPALADQVRGQREVLESARDLVQAKNADEARAMLRGVLVRARELEYRPLRAEALLQIGGIETDLDHDYARAAGRFHDAVADALASGYEGAAARAWVELAGNATSRQAYEEARMWADYARQALKRRPDPAVEQNLEGALTWLCVHEGDPKAALAHAQRALEIEEASAGPEHPRAISALNLVSVAHYYGHQKDEALRYLHRALAIAENVHGPRHPALSAPLNNIGVILTDQKKYDEAAEYYERSLSIREATLDERHQHLHQAYDNLAELLWRDGQYARALPHAERTVELGLASDVGAQAQIKATHRVGLIHLDLGDAQAAAPHLRKAMEMWEAMPEDQRDKFADARYRFDVARLDWELGEDRRAARAVAREALATLESGGKWHGDDAARVRAWLEAHR
jgi:tetratricopeptide (TPR) repeat protein/predicted Ser/Thr protein kinase